jgi:hypothetical protein
MLEIERRGEEPRSFAVTAATEPYRNNRMIAGDPLKQAVQHQRADNTGEAVPRRQEIANATATHQDALHDLALVRFQQEEFNESRALLEKLLAMAPDHAAAHRLLDIERRGEKPRSFSVDPTLTSGGRRRVDRINAGAGKRRNNRG